MSDRRTFMITLLVTAVVAGGQVLAQDAVEGRDAKIADATSAGPAAIARDATIVEWPAAPGTEFRVLREGTNDWLCIASSDVAIAAGLQDPICDDPVWQEFEHAFMEGREPVIEALGVSYMLAGDAGVSNVDPFATGPSDDNEWHVNGPHLMILVPDPAMLEGLSTDPHHGGPYVMWNDTPYAHVMVPVDPFQPTNTHSAAAADAERAADAMGAAPAALAGRVTVLAGGSDAAADARVLRDGDAGWVCTPSGDAVRSEGMRGAGCDDEVWQAWRAALAAGTSPSPSRLGIAYALNHDAVVGWQDPLGNGGSSDVDGHHEGPHVAILVPGGRFGDMPTDPSYGGPYVRYADTPYAHVVVPLGSGE